MAIAALNLSPSLIVRGGQKAIDFYQQAFGAQLDYKLVDPTDGRIGHAELLFGQSRIYLADEYPDFGAVSPERIGGSPVRLYLDVADAEASLAQAVVAGATVLQPLRVEFHGHKIATVADPFGYSWTLSTQVEQVTPEEMQRRWNSMLESGGAG